MTLGKVGSALAFDAAAQFHDAQIRSRQRVRDLAEVYTHEREVSAMLDLIPDMFPSEDRPEEHDRTFLEPACGSGNFLEATLRRKLSTVTSHRYGNGRRFEFRVMRCLVSIYGIDIDAENVEHARLRLLEAVRWHLHSQLNTREASTGFYESVGAVLQTNIVQADTLTDGPRIELVSYQPTRGAAFKRTWSMLEEPARPEQPDLFSTLHESRRDAVGVHYALLADNPRPISLPEETG